MRGLVIGDGRGDQEGHDALVLEDLASLVVVAVDEGRVIATPPVDAGPSMAAVLDHRDDRLADMVRRVGRLAGEAVLDMQPVAHLRLRRRGMLPAGANPHDPAAGPVEVVGDRGQQHCGAFLVGAVIMHHGAAVGDQAGRFGLGEAPGDIADRAGGNAAFLLGEFRRELGHLLLDGGDLVIHRGMVVGRYPHELEVVLPEQALVHDDVGHGQHHQPVHANIDRDPFGRFGGGIR